MKKLLLLIVGIIVIIYFLPDNDYNASSSSTPSSPVSGSLAGNEKALAEVRKESKVLEAMITDANVLYVSVVDDGTRRDGYASYLCELLRENNAKATRVKVVKVNSTNDPDRDNAYGVLLGESWCN